MKENFKNVSENMRLDSIITKTNKQTNKKRDCK